MIKTYIYRSKKSPVAQEIPTVFMLQRKCLLVFMLYLGAMFAPTALFAEGIIQLQDLNQLRKGISLKNHLVVYEDLSDTAKVCNLINNASRFVPLPGFRAINPTDKYFLRCVVLNNTSIPVDVSLFFKNLTYVELYVMEGGKISERRVSGAFQKADSIASTDSRTDFALTINSDDSITILLGVRHIKHHFPEFDFAIQDILYYNKAKYTKQAYDFFILGAFCIFLALSLLSLSFNRNSHYLWLAIYSFGMTTYGFMLNGYFIDIFTPNYPKETWAFVAILPNISNIGVILLLKYFFKLRENFPSVNKLVVGLIVAIGIQGLIVYLTTAITQNYLVTSMINITCFALTSLLIIVVVAYLWRHLKREQHMIAIAALAHASLFLIGVIIYYILRESANKVLPMINDVGGLFIITFSTIAVAEQMRHTEKDKYEALNMVKELQRKQNSQLEETVVLRTSELQIANQTLTRQKTELEVRNEKIEILIKEIHHRVKNNLQLVSSLLELHLRKDDSERFAAIIADGQNRVKAMSLIHQMLFQENDYATINMDAFIRKLLMQVNASYSIPFETELVVECNHIMLDLDTAIPLGLIINELVTNAFKYALYFSEYPELTITLEPKQEGEYLLTVSDNGPGLPEDFAIESDSNIGLYLIPRLCRQLDGSFGYSFNKGAVFTVAFKDTFTRKQTS